MEHHNKWIGDPYRHKEAQQITPTDNDRSVTGDHHHHITDNSLLRQTIDNHVVLIMIEINHTTDPPGNPHIDKTINKEIIGLLAHIDQVINQLDNQVLTETMNTEADTIVQKQMKCSPVFI